MEINQTEIKELFKEFQGESDFRRDANLIWVLLAGVLVFFMHAGFTMLEVGSVRHKNAVNIMFKNFGTLSIGGLMFYAFGWAFAYGSQGNSFIGTSDFFITELGPVEQNGWFFQFAFAATAATIVSGAVAGRINLVAYFVCAAWITAFVYPVVVRWVWGGGFLAAGPLFADDCGMIDYAGSGVVHLTGATAALAGAFLLGPRLGRYDSEGVAQEIPPHNISLQTLGTFILWMGWYGFNCGSTLGFDGINASKVAVTTTLAPSAAIAVSIIYSRVVKKHYDIGLTLNSALGGLVSITAGCSVVAPYSSIIIGAIGCIVYIVGSFLMKKIKVDDPVDAIAVHGFCGIWGCLAVGIFATPALIKEAGLGDECTGNTAAKQIVTQLVGVACILGWVLATTIPVFLALKATKMLRVPQEYEEEGLDLSEHGGSKAFFADASIEPTQV